MKLLLLIPDGVGIRNYLYSDLLKYCRNNQVEVSVWHKLNPEVIAIAEKLHDLTIDSNELKLKPQAILVRLLRETTTYARLKLNARLKENPTILYNWSKGSGSLKHKLLFFSSEFFGKLIKSYKQVEKIEKLMYRLEEKPARTYVEILKQIKPDVVFCTHQRVAEISPIIIAAKKLGIKTATAIFSWDNLPKARLPFRVDKYFVWSDYMKSELDDYYPEIKNSQIEITGSPQFDFYKKNELIISREKFAEKYGLDITKKWVLFTGDDKRTSPFDAHYLKDVAEALKNEDNIQLLFREVPVEQVDRYKKVLSEFSIKRIPPLWVKNEHWGNFYPLFGDVVLLVNLAFHCATVINVGSTLAHDFAHFDKPASYLNYDQEIAKNWSVKTIYQFQHFRSMPTKNTVLWINSREEIKQKIQTSLDFPESVANNRLEWMKKIVGNQVSSAAEKIFNSLTN